MTKPRRTLLSDLVPAAVEETAVVEISRRNATKQATIQQTVYLPPAVHEQLRDLAHIEREKMHTFIMEGLDAVFKKRGLKSIAELTTKSS